MNGQLETNADNSNCEDIGHGYSLEKVLASRFVLQKTEQLRQIQETISKGNPNWKLSKFLLNLEIFRKSL